MVRLIRSLAIFGLSGGLSIVALQWAVPGATSEAAPEITRQYASLGSRMSLGAGYSLPRLEILGSTLYYVEESYVEPQRIDYEKMFVSALEAVERRVPVTMFRREPGGSLLHVEIGEHRTVLEVEPVSTRRQLQTRLHEVATLLQEHLSPADVPDVVGSGDPYAEIEYALVNGVLSTLDPHSVLLPPEDSKEMDVENQGGFGGLGITIVDREGRLVIDYPLPDTPADRAGLRPDDQIVRVDGETTINMSLDEAVGRLRGEIGEPVTLEVLREGEPEPLTFTIVRERIKLNPVEVELLDGAIGYVSIRSFHAAVGAELTEGLSQLATASRGGLKGLVLDLRGNPGGYMTQAVLVADAFLEQGMIVAQVSGRGARDSEELARVAGTQPSYPIVVLVNANSASASEIVAGALRNNDRAVILGERTFGKGSVQNLHAFVDDSKLKLTISKYLTPGDRSIQSVGIPADIELVPTIAEERDVAGAKEPNALVFWRERARREADLGQHLGNADVVTESPAYSLRYHRPSDLRRRSSTLDLSGDYEVQLARDILLGAPSWRRGEILAAVGPLVQRHARRNEATIESAFSTLGIDWRAGPTPERPALSVRVDVGGDGTLRAGQEAQIAVEVRNDGDAPVHRLVAVSSSDGDILDGREFVFGRIQPGETRRYVQRVRVVDGYPTQVTPVWFSLRDQDGVEIDKAYQRVPVEGRALPRFAWSWTLGDAVEGGDGDGVTEAGETLALDVRVENIGEGVSGEAFLRLKNQSGAAVDLDRGSLSPGTHRDADGVACAPVAGSEPVTWPKGCTPKLLPGEVWEGRFLVSSRAGVRGPLKLELSVGDATAYDHASVFRSGFYSYFANLDTIEIPLDEPVPVAARRQPPAIAITRAPEVLVRGDQVTLSGVVTDDVGVDHLMVFHGDDKIAFDGSGRDGRLRSVPFTASVRLEPGLNTLSVLARDVDGYTATQAIVTYFVDPEQQARLDAFGDPGSL